jgi:biopolymer transport protein ExbB
MIDFLWAMGPFLLPLLLLSIYGVGLIFQKQYALRAARPLKAEVFGRILDEVSRGGWAADLVALEHPVGHLLDHAGEAPNLLQARAQVLLSGLEDRISYFPALANVATLTGLFGTVCGMIGAFFSLRAGGGADPGALAGGLGQALVATALGLVTAIPSLTAHAVFQKRVQAVASQMEAVLSALLPTGGVKEDA